MAKKLQKKVATALTKRRTQLDSNNDEPDWKTALKASAFYDVIPSLESLNITIEQYQDSSPSNMQELFVKIVDVLKKEYFDQRQNRLRLKKHLVQLYYPLRELSDDSQKKAFVTNYIKSNQSSISLLFINSHLDFAIKFSRLLICVIGRLVKDALNLPKNQYDEKNICNIIDELTQLQPNFTSATLEWFENELNVYVPNPEDETQHVINDDPEDYLTEPLLELVKENQIADEEDINTLLSQELNSDNPILNSKLIEQICLSEPLASLTTSTVSNGLIRKTYLQIHRSLLPQLDLTHTSSKKHFRQFVAQAINQAINTKKPSSKYNLKVIQKICTKQSQELASIRMLCKEIKLQRANYKSFLQELKNLQSTSKVEILESFINKKLQAPLYLKNKKKINRIIKRKDYSNNNRFVINCIHYMKILLTQPFYENSLITEIRLKNPRFIEPISIDELSHIKNCIRKLEKNTTKRDIKRECTFLLHALAFDQELVMRLQKISQLCNADFSSMQVFLIEPLDNGDLAALVQHTNEITVNSKALNAIIDKNQRDTIKTELLDYQQQVRELGALHLMTLQTPDDESVYHKINETYLKITKLYEDLTVIIELISVFNILSDKNISDDLRLLVGEIREHLPDINESFVSLTNIAHEFGYKKVDPNDIFILRLTRGDFFYQKDHDILKNAVSAMLSTVSPLELIDSILNQFASYSDEQRNECVFFIEKYLESDTQHGFFSAINSENNEFYLKLMTLVHSINSFNISTTKLMELINRSISLKKEDFDKFILKLANGEFSKVQLVRHLNTIAHNLNENNFNVTKLDDYLEEISHITESAEFDNFTPLEQSQLLNSLNKLTDVFSSFPLYKPKFNKLKININAILLKKSGAANLHKPFVTPNNFNPNSSLLVLIKEAVESNNKNQYNKAISKFVSTIEAEFSNLFQKIDLSELRDLNWTFDRQRHNDGLTPLSPNVIAYHLQYEKAVQYISFTLFYNLDNHFHCVSNQFTEVKAIYSFIENALIRALELKAPTTASILYKAIQTPAIKRLALSSPKAEQYYLTYLNKTKEAQVKITKLFREDGVLPLLSFIQQMLIFSNKKTSGSQIERLSNIGRSLKYFEHKKETLRKGGIVTDFSSDANYFLHLLKVSSIQTGKLDLKKSQQLLMMASVDLKPDTSTKYVITEFKTVNELAKYLNQCHSKFSDFHFDSENPNAEIYSWLLTMIKSDTRFSSFTDSVEVLFLVDEINRYQKRTYKQFNSDLISILTFYYKRVSKILKSDNESDKKTLELFFVQLNKLIRLRDLGGEEESRFDLFSSDHRVKDLVKKMHEQHRLYLSMQEQFEKHRSQSAYSQLLSDVLSGNTQKSLALPVEHDEQRIRTSETLLPENEYDIPSAEPEHPARIGINKTMSFTTQDQASILALFNTEELKAEFLKAFPWAIQVDSLDKLKKLQFDPHMNLLGTTRHFCAPLQLAVMKLVLIAMDSLGKIAGFTGQLTLSNFDRINEIINQLKWLTGELQSFNVEEPKLLGEVEAVIQEMGYKNQEYYDIQQLYNPPFEVENNPNMNGFCHLNEHLAYQLTGSDYEETLLAPPVPGSPYFEQISQIVVNHEKT